MTKKITSEGSAQEAAEGDGLQELNSDHQDQEESDGEDYSYRYDDYCGEHLKLCKSRRSDRTKTCTRGEGSCLVHFAPL
jgi:hypothetical protein